MTTGTTFPKFPTQFTEKEAKRLKELEEQKALMGQIYGTKFTGEAWAKTPAVERKVREFLPSWLSPIVRTLTPWEKGAWDYGFTPEQAMEERYKVAEEIKGLAREEKVTRLLPQILSSLEIAALSGAPVESFEEFVRRAFPPEISVDFNDEEKQFISRYGYELLRASKEDILSGKVLAQFFEGFPPPLTDQGWEDYFKQAPPIDPRFILSTVAFSKDVGEISEALRLAYPPQVEEVKSEDIERLIQERTDFYKQWAIDQGIRPEEGESTTDFVARAQKELGNKEGENIALINQDTGETVIGQRKQDNTVWVGGNLVGSWDEKSKQVVLINQFSGQPIGIDVEQESVVKDLWDSFYLGLSQAWYGSKQAVLSVIPDALLNVFKKWEAFGLEQGTITQEHAEYNTKAAEEIQDRLRVSQEQRELEYQEWLKAHPELQPKPEYSQSVFDNPSLARDPGWYANIILNQAPIWGSALLVGIITGVLTKNPAAGAVAGATVMTPVQINAVYDDLIANGADKDTAANLATSIGTAIGAIEIIPEMIFLKAVAPTFMRMFRKNLSTELVKNLSARGIFTTAAKIEVAETLEEIIQQAMQNAAVKTVNENRSLVEGLDQTAIQTIISVFPMAVIGGGGAYLNMKANLPPETQAEIDKTATKLKEAGLSDEHAEAVAFTQALEDEKVQAQVEKAIEKVEEQEPVATPETPLDEARAKKLSAQESKLELINQDIDTWSNSLKQQQDRLSKQTLPFERAETQETINGLQEQLDELVAKKKRATKAIDKLRQPAAPVTLEPIIPVTELTTPLPTNPEVVGEQISEELGIIYDGVQEGIGMQFTDSQTKSTTYGNTLEEVRTNIENIRERFTAVTPEATQEPTVEGVAPPVELPTRPTAPAGELPDRRPKLVDFDIEVESTNATVRNSPVIARRMERFMSKKVKANRARAEQTLEELHTRYDQATKEDRSAIAKEFTALARSVGLRQKDLLANHWNDLDFMQQAKLALAMIPDRSIQLQKKYEAADVKHFVRWLEEETGLPFYQLYPRVRMDFGTSQRQAEKELEVLKKIEIGDVRTNKESLAKVTQAINSLNPRLNIDRPELTDNEGILATIVANVFQSYEPYIRHLRVTNTDSNIESMKAEFPDAVEAGKENELQAAILLKEGGDLDGLWSFLKNVSWGTIQGYTPWMKAKASVFPRAIRLGTTRGESRLMRRESIDFDESLGENILLDLVRYVKQVEAQWRLRPDLEMYEELWKLASRKFVNNRRIENKLQLWAKELQGMPPEGADTIFQDIVNRTWRTAMSAVFLKPRMSYRNIFQALAFHPDRTELFRLLAQRPDPAFMQQLKIYYDNNVHQLGGIRQDFLLTGGNAIPGLNWLVRIADSLSLYAQSDNIPRMASFFASANKAWRATQDYMSSEKTAKDVDRWITKSGAIHLTHTEQNYALSLLAQAEGSSNLGTPGLEDASGIFRVSSYMGNEIADRVHFLYQRAFRAPAEMGTAGRVLYNLIVFPRGYAQRVLLDWTKVKGAFHGEATWTEAADGFKDFLLMVAMGALISQFISLTAGWKRRAYSPMSILQYQLGGLAVGIAQDLGELVAAIFTYLDTSADDDDKARALGTIPILLDRAADTLVPFYSNIIAAIAVMMGKEDMGIDTAFRELRAILDDKYEAPEIEEIERTLWEKIRKAVLLGEVEDPTNYEEMFKAVQEQRDELGNFDAQGRRYTTQDFGNFIQSQMKIAPDDIWTDRYGWNPLVVFYAECCDAWQPLLEMPSQPASLKQDWRKSHVEEEAMLIFWGKYSTSVFTKQSKEGRDILKLLDTWSSYYGIEDRMMPKAGWREEGGWAEEGV